jgi:radical SAM superfamily enzyme YgiQ (UPF0313 family)
MRPPFILLINPWIHDFAAYDLWVKPVGLLTIADALQSSGFRLRLVDCLRIPESSNHKSAKIPRRKSNGSGHFLKKKIPRPSPLGSIQRTYRRYGMPEEVFIDEISAEGKPDMVLVTSMMTYWYPGVFDAIRLTKMHYPDVPLALGGVYATLCPDHARRLSGADSICSGPAETALPAVIEKATGKKTVAGSCCRPYACRYDLLPTRSVLPVMTSRGCPNRCPYCASDLLYKDFHQRNPAEVADKIHCWVHNSGTTDIVFYDDALLINSSSHIIPLLKEIIRRKLNIRFHAPNGLHIKHIDNRLAGLMKEAGFVTLRLGLETAHPEKQKTLGGKVSGDDFPRAAQALRNAGFTAHEVGVYILAGLPHQHWKEVYDTIHLVHDQGLRPFVAEYSPIPGTSLWSEAVKSSPFPIETEPLFHNNTLLPCRWEGFTEEHLSFLKEQSRLHRPS